jgi:plasmid stabilization system protein ParE
MGLKIVTKKRFLNRLQKTTKYLKDNWGKKEAEGFVLLVIEKIDLVSEKPNMGAMTAIKNTRSVLAGKANQTKI